MITTFCVVNRQNQVPLSSAQVFNQDANELLSKVEPIKAVTVDYAAQPSSLPAALHLPHNEATGTGFSSSGSNQKVTLGNALGSQIKDPNLLFP